MMRFLPDLPARRPLRLLCIGAHSDDVEIGCGGTVLSWLAVRPALEVTWVVLSATGERAGEARRSAAALLKGAVRTQVVLGDFRDSFFPAQYAALKEFVANLRSRVDPDVILTHCQQDRHQDHRLTSELTWNTWRDHVVLEYEIAKYEGDLGQPNAYVPIPARLARRKAVHLERHFGSQRGRSWFHADTFLGLMRVRGIECRSASGFAEAFHARKLVIAPSTGTQ